MCHPQYTLTIREKFVQETFNHIFSYVFPFEYQKHAKLSTLYMEAGVDKDG